MSDIHNSGKKGYLVLYVFMFFFFFFITWAYVYYSNYNNL
ncbi:MAG: hypothetical protein ACI8VT_001526 [Saprospiraceae bacterium]|jgi:hypothetical protein